MPYDATNQPYLLPKRFRYEEEGYLDKSETPWSKEIIDMNKHTCLSRNCLNWCLLFVFYLIFYLSLAALFGICMLVLLRTLDPDVPRIAGKQPGLSFQPCVVPHKGTKCTIFFTENNEADCEKYAGRIDQFLAKFTNELYKGDRYGPCNFDDQYGLRKNEPCVFLKVNRVIGVKVQPIETVEALPFAAPTALRREINSLSEEERKGRIWLSCEARIGGARTTSVDLSFYPNNSVPISATVMPKKVVRRSKFDWTTPWDQNMVIFDWVKVFYDEKDLERVVAVQLKNVPRDTEILLQCSMWAKNIVIEHDGHMGVGLIRLYVRIDSN